MWAVFKCNAHSVLCRFPRIIVFLPFQMRSRCEWVSFGSCDSRMYVLSACLVHLMQKSTSAVVGDERSMYTCEEHPIRAEVRKRISSDSRKEEEEAAANDSPALLLFFVFTGACFSWAICARYFDQGTTVRNGGLKASSPCTCPIRETRTSETFFSQYCLGSFWLHGENKTAMVRYRRYPPLSLP